MIADIVGIRRKMGIAGHILMGAIRTTAEADHLIGVMVAIEHDASAHPVGTRGGVFKLILQLSDTVVKAAVRSGLTGDSPAIQSY